MRPLLPITIASALLAISGCAQRSRPARYFAMPGMTTVVLLEPCELDSTGTRPLEHCKVGFTLQGLEVSKSGKRPRRARRN